MDIRLAVIVIVMCYLTQVETKLVNEDYLTKNVSHRPFIVSSAELSNGSVTVEQIEGSSLHSRKQVKKQHRITTRLRKHVERFQQHADAAKDEESSGDDVCCYNEGSCIMGSFCICPPEFTGRRCETSALKRVCGPIEHDGIGWLGCSFCLCWDGILTCLPQVRKQCFEDNEVYDVISVDMREEKPKTLSDTNIEFDANDLEQYSNAPSFHVQPFLMLLLVCALEYV